LCLWLSWKEQYSFALERVWSCCIGFGADPRLILDGIEDVVHWEIQRGEVLLRFVSLKRIRKENRERLLFESGLPLILVNGMGQSLAL